MGLFTNVFDDKKQTVTGTKDLPLPTIKETKKPEPEKEKKYIKRITIVWEDKSRPDTVIDLVDKTSFSPNDFDGFVTIQYSDDDNNTVKRIYFPIRTIRQITSEVIEVT